MPRFNCSIQSKFSIVMTDDSGGRISATKRKATIRENSPPAKMAANFNRTKRGLFKEYNHIYKEEGKKDYPVLLSMAPSIDDSSSTKLDLLKINNILKSVKGVSYVRPVGLRIIKVFFSSKADANNFIMNSKLQKTHGWIARIPYDHLESQGIIKVPTELTEEQLLQELQADIEIIGIKRFERKMDNILVPTPTVLVTFLSSTAPDHVTYDFIWFEVKKYVRPLQQCFTCYKFGHSKNSCKSKQVCSICSGEHFFNVCNNQANIKCINCKSTDHIAVSSSCPIKKAKLNEIKDQISGKSTYASITAKSAFPSLKQESSRPQRRALLSELINSDEVISVITKTVLDILKKKDSVSSTKSDASTLVSSKVIKELLITNFAS